MNTGLIETLRQRQASGGDPAVTAEIQTAVVSRRNQRGEHREWALLCEQAGLLSLAFSEFQLALRDDPQDPLAAFHLAQHYRERGDTTRALGLLERLLAGDPAEAAWLETYVEILVEDGAEPRAEQALARAEQHGLAERSRPPPCGARWASVAGHRRDPGTAPQGRTRPGCHRRRLRPVLHPVRRPGRRLRAAVGPAGRRDRLQPRPRAAHARRGPLPSAGLLYGRRLPGPAGQHRHVLCPGPGYRQGGPATRPRRPGLRPSAPRDAPHRSLAAAGRPAATGFPAAVRELGLQGPALLGVPRPARDGRHAAPAGPHAAGLAGAAAGAGLALGVLSQAGPAERQEFGEPDQTAAGHPPPHGLPQPHPG